MKERKEERKKGRKKGGKKTNYALADPHLKVTYDHEYAPCQCKVSRTIIFPDTLEKYKVSDTP